MMFGLPAACLAMYHTALPDRRRAVAGLLASIALTSFLTGVTEPVEFSFMFLAPALYAVHALLTGLSFIIMNALHVRLGFGFSAGLFDYLLNYKFASRPLLLLPVGALYFGLYYGIFRVAIVRFDLKTPGRESTDTAVAAAEPTTAAEGARAYIAALGGAANLEAVNACTTRLRLTVKAQEVVDVQALKRLGARGVVRPSATALQVVIGPVADRLAGEIRDALAAMSHESAHVQPRATAAHQAQEEGTNFPAEVPLLAKAAMPLAEPVMPLAMPVIEKLLDALGGRANVRNVERASSRLRVGVVSAAKVDGSAIRTLGLRGVAVATADCVHVIVGPAAQSACKSLRELLAT
jgi:PTS system N-acetylglucosamine-specific IIC component